MISLEDCIGLCGLDEDEVAAISEHEHIPEIAAAALASYLLTQPRGGETIRTMIIDDIHKALDEGRVGRSAELFMALRHFLEHHPEGRAGGKYSPAEPGALGCEPLKAADGSSHQASFVA